MQRQNLQGSNFLPSTCSYIWCNNLNPFEPFFKMQRSIFRLYLANTSGKPRAKQHQQETGGNEKGVVGI